MKKFIFSCLLLVCSVISFPLCTTLAQSSIPATGDRNQINVLIVLCILAFVLIVGAVVIMAFINKKK